MKSAGLARISIKEHGTLTAVGHDVPEVSWLAKATPSSFSFVSFRAQIPKMQR